MTTETEKEIVAGGYSRLSVVENDNNELSQSIKNQKKFIKEFADKNNIILYDFYDDDGYSGSNFDRPGFKRLINDIECGFINCVITKDISRLGRDFIDTGNYIYKYFPEHDVRFIAILDNFDTGNPSDSDDVIPFKAAINDMYLKDTSKKIKTVRHDLMEQGLFVGSSVPYGYKRSKEDNRKFVIDEYASNVVKRIFNMKLDGLSSKKIADTLTNEGILPPNVYNGKKIAKTITTNIWKDSSVNHILSNEVYIGTLIQGKYGRVSSKSKKKKLLPRNQWVIKKNNHDAIIDKDIFYQVNAEKNENKKTNTRFRKYDYLLKGLVVCADCGKTMQVRKKESIAKKKKGQTYAHYCCSTCVRYGKSFCSMHYYLENDLNELVFKELKSLLIKYSNRELLSKEYDITLSNNNVLEKYKAELDSAMIKVKSLDKAISELYKDKISGVISEDEFISIKQNLTNEKVELEKNINNLKIMLGKSKDNLMDDNNKKKIINDFLKMKNPNKQILQALISKITIDETKKVKIYFKFNINGEV